MIEIFLKDEIIEEEENGFEFGSVVDLCKESNF